ncbi:MAG: BON domain-containing protein [Acidobacteria bacterium]|nr:BON domain-containing protein [Acidobacteriota bacterium]
MMVRNWIAACALGVLTVAPAASAQTHSAAKVDDSAIKSRVEAKLKSADSLKNDHIVVAVDNGVVTLSGTVHSEAQSLRARELAKVEGVTNVENKLDVDSATADAAKGATAKTKDATVHGAEKTKNATVHGAEKTKNATVTGAEKTKDATRQRHRRSHQRRLDHHEDQDGIRQRGRPEGQRHQRRHERSRCDAEGDGGNAGRKDPRRADRQNDQRRAQCCEHADGRT